MIKIEKDKKYLITGGSGFLGGELITRILKDGGKVVTVSRNEGQLIKLKQKFPSVQIETGDITNKHSVHRVMSGVTGVFHLAAFKHVGMAETQSVECINSNVIGSKNVLECSVEEGVDFVIGISTDKAAQVAGVYGASKLLMEKMFKQYEVDYPNLKFRLVRYGNVLYSTGSVLCKWKELLKNGEQVIVTEPSATRFFWTLDQAVDLIYDCMRDATDCEIHFPSMKSMSIDNLLKAMAEKYLPSETELKIKSIGLQPGENLHERILEEGPDSNEVEEFTIEEIKELI
jgi:FlaA1/EpsC-like NDP-sugar epimerase|tara:strand:+ start:3575 stop:4435 length:861 start_codon:yes stop_codon:yes gene_type:complete